MIGRVYPGLLNNARRSFQMAQLRGHGIAFGHARAGLILMYHRVTRASSDPWRLAVSPERFAGHMAVLSRLGLCCTVSDLADSLRTPEAPAPRVAVSFDDGYLDNLTDALPVLEREGVPATLYVPSQAIGDARAFWWDRLQRIFLETPFLPERLTLTDARGEALHFALGREARLSPAGLARLAAWRADHSPARSIRQKLYLDLWQQLSVMPRAQRIEALDHLDQWAGGQAPAYERPMTGPELSRFAASPLIEIGGHTANHVDLSRVSAQEGAKEILEDRSALQRMTGQELRSFALPFGRARAETSEQIRAAGYSNATCSQLGLCKASSDPFRLPRFQVEDMSARAFERCIRWMVQVPPNADIPALNKEH